MVLGRQSRSGSLSAVPHWASQVWSSCFEMQTWRRSFLFISCRCSRLLHSLRSCLLELLQRIGAVRVPMRRASPALAYPRREAMQVQRDGRLGVSGKPIIFGTLGCTSASYIELRCLFLQNRLIRVMQTSIMVVFPRCMHWLPSEEQE